MGAIRPFHSLCRKKDLRVRCASCPNYRHSLDNRGWFSRDRFHFRKFHEQFFNLALLMRLGEAGLRHDAILSLRGLEEKHSDCTTRTTSSVERLKHSAKPVGLKNACNGALVGQWITKLGGTSWVNPHNCDDQTCQTSIPVRQWNHENKWRE